MGRYTLDTFYQSKEWAKFRQVVIADRVQPDGFVYDEVTGQPIVRQYDIILHHKVYLTEANVNDASVALNPDNIQIVSHRTHNKIHNKFGYKRQEVFLVFGSPLAGKTSYVRENMIPGDLVLDLDIIWYSITGGLPYTKPPCLNPVAFGIRDYILESIRIRRGRWQNAYIIGGYPLISERERLCRQTGAREIFIDTPKRECLERLKNDKNRDKAEWEKYINVWWERYTTPRSAEN